MANGINIGIASDTRDFKRGVDNGVIKPLEDVVDVYGEVSRAGDKAADNLEQGFKGAQKDTKELRKEYDRLGDDIKAASYKGRTSMVNDSDAATQRGKENVKELGNEAKANLAETLASFDGTVEGTISGIQGTLGGVTAGLTGVVPIIAAAAGAAGLGLLAVAFQTSSEQAEKVREKVAELAGELIETGGVGERSMDSMVDALKELATTSEDGVKSLSDLAKLAKDSGLEFSKIAQSYVGNSDALKGLIDTNAERIKQLEEEADLQDQTTNSGVAKYSALLNQIAATDALNGTLKENYDVTVKAEKAEQDYLNSGAPEMEAKAAAVANINDAYDSTAGAVTDYINAETGVLDVGAYITAMEAKSDALKNYQDNLAASMLSDTAKTYLNEQGADAAAQFLDGYVKASPEQRAQLNKIWTEAGLENSGTYVTTLNGAIGNAQITGPNVILQTDTALKQISDLFKNPQTLKVNLSGLSLNAIAGKKVI